MSNDWAVSFEQEGRGGTVVYRDAGGELRFWWEFGAGDAVAMIRVGTADEWVHHYAWAAPRRDQILGRVADECIRVQAPSCRAVLDDQGWLTLRRNEPPRYESSPPDPPRARADPPGRGTARAADPRAVFTSRMRALSCVALGAVSLAAMALVGFALLRNVFMIRVTGSPRGHSMRSGPTIVTLIGCLEPYVPSLNRDHSKDLMSVGMLVHNVENGSRRYIELARGRSQAALGLSKLIAIKGDRVWADTPETMMVDLATGDKVDAQGLAANPSLAPPQRKRTLADFAGDDDTLSHELASGGLVESNRWLGLHTGTEVIRDCRAGMRAPVAMSFAQTYEPRRIYAGTTATDGQVRRFGSLRPSGAAEFTNGAWVRSGRDGGLLSLAGSGRLMVHQTKPRRAGTWVATRTNAGGSVVWQTNTGIAVLDDVLPDPDRPAFAGLRPAAEGKVPEPILVVVEAQSGRLTTHSLLVED